MEHIMVARGNSYGNNVCPKLSRRICLAWTLLSMCNLPFLNLTYLLQEQGVVERRKEEEDV